MGGLQEVRGVGEVETEEREVMVAMVVRVVATEGVVRVEDE